MDNSINYDNLYRDHHQQVNTHQDEYLTVGLVALVYIRIQLKAMPQCALIINLKSASWSQAQNLGYSSLAYQDFDSKDPTLYKAPSIHEHAYLTFSWLVLVEATAPLMKKYTWDVCDVLITSFPYIERKSSRRTARENDNGLQGENNHVWQYLIYLSLYLSISDLIIYTYPSI